MCPVIFIYFWKLNYSCASHCRCRFADGYRWYRNDGLCQQCEMYFFHDYLGWCAVRLLQRLLFWSSDVNLASKKLFTTYRLDHPICCRRSYFVTCWRKRPTGSRASRKCWSDLSMRPAADLFTILFSSRHSTWQDYDRSCQHVLCACSVKAAKVAKSDMQTYHDANLIWWPEGRFPNASMRSWSRASQATNTAMILNT